MEIFFSIVSILSLAFCTLVIIDRIVFMQSMKAIDRGMTGKEIQEMSGLKIEIVKVSGNTYYGIVKSKMTIFKYKLMFLDGKLVSKVRD